MCCVILVSHLPIMSDDNELKTKPTQQAVRALNRHRLQPDIILARAKYPLDEKRKEKIAFNCGLREEGRDFRAGRFEHLRHARQF